MKAGSFGAKFKETSLKEELDCVFVKFAFSSFKAFVKF